MSGMALGGSASVGFVSSDEMFPAIVIKRGGEILLCVGRRLPSLSGGEFKMPGPLFGTGALLCQPLGPR